MSMTVAPETHSWASAERRHHESLTLARAKIGDLVAVVGNIDEATAEGHRVVDQVRSARNRQLPSARLPRRAGVREDGQDDCAVAGLDDEAVARQPEGACQERLGPSPNSLVWV